ncbi:MAG: ABC transporter transmembrane domain-containing protein, partial [Hyphomicrobiaceae bacterium]
MDSNLFRFIWKHSRRDQLFILGLIVASLPFYWASLDIPKRIINDGLQGRIFKQGQQGQQIEPTVPLGEISLSLPDFLGGGTYVLSSGFLLTQMEYLFALSALFLLFVLINGAFKYVININKGVLGERMLRRMRFELFALLLRFRPEDIRAVKPAEAASMIKDEVEPIGGFIGDAFIQPAFLGLQALTALIFILVQSSWLGLVALIVVLIQAFVIPRLRREQIRLGRERQIASRKLAGRIGEVVEGAAAVHVHGTAPYNSAEVGGRLGHLFKIRVDLFKRKFAVKYLNNFLAQITPFFFYAIGGYLALTGSLDIGQLVAVIAAYRDLPPPIKELIDWDQQRVDVEVKYQQIVSQFSADRLLPPASGAGTFAVPASNAPIAIDGLRVVDRRGSALLETMSTVIERPAHVALIGAAGSGRDMLAKVLGRQVSEFQGSVRIGGQKLNEIPDETASRFLTYAGADPTLFSGSVRDNVLISLHCNVPKCGPDDQASAAERLRRLEAHGSGNPLERVEDDWIDYRQAGIEGTERLPERLEEAILAALRITGLHEDIYRFGLLGKLEPGTDPEIIARFLEARRAIHARIGAKDLRKLVSPFDPKAYNANATIGENLMFGVPIGGRLAGAKLAGDPYFRAILATESLEEPLTDIGLKTAETTLEIFASVPAGHALIERFSFIPTDELEDFQRIVDSLRAHDARVHLSNESRARLIALALAYVEPRHRLGLVGKVLEKRILRARASFHRHLPQDYAAAIEFYDPNRFLMASPIRDNLLFGRIAFGTSNAEQTIWQAVRALLIELKLEAIIYRLGLDYDVGPGGKLLFGPQRAAVNLARCLIKRPDLFVIDGALSAYGDVE